MKKNNKAIILSLTFVILASLVITKGGSVKSSAGANPKTITTASVQFVNSEIAATGTVTAQNQATLAFQTSGKLVYLPLKEGDKVFVGQTIAKLDTYALQRQLTAALNTYKSTRDSFDQQQDNVNNNVLKTQITSTYSSVTGIDSTTAINQAIQRIADQSQTTLGNSVINVELANYALTLSSLTSPLKGIITHEGVTTSGINITPTTTFTIADPDSMVFRANVPIQQIYYVSLGSKVLVAVDGIKDNFEGIVTKIYPSKVTLSNGESVYQVDIQSDSMKKAAKLDETGTVMIRTNSENVALVPAWTVLNGKYIWIDNDGKPELREVTPGKIHGDQIEILGGLSVSDKIITDPKYISIQKYQIL